MAQILKHRRGSITGLKDVTARMGEIIVATGSISDMNGPWVFIGSDEIAGGYRPISKIYEGSNVPTIAAGSYGSTIDGTPFYSTTNKTLYVLSQTGNRNINLTGNIEGNIISGVTINNLTGTTATITNISGSFTGSGLGLYNIPASGITGLELNKISQGSATASISETNGLRVNTKSEITGSLIVTSDITGSNLFLSGNAKIDGNITLGGNITVGNNDTDFVVFGAEISSSIVPDIHNAFDLGSTTKNWRNLHVSGTGYVNTLDVASSAQFKSTINVDSEATLASATVEDLTQNRIVGVGSGGSLIDYSGLTYNGTTFKIGNGLFEIDNNDGDIRTSGSLTVENNQTINGDMTVNGVLIVTGNTQLGGNLYVSGNLEILGSATEVHISSSVIELDDNIIKLNAYSPFERYAGFEVMDSGSSGVSASLVWDSLNDYWLFVSSSGQSSKLIGSTAGSYGSEISLTNTYFPISTGTNTIGNSLLRYSGTTLSFNTNKFTIDSIDGSTLIAGNVTLSFSGGTDNGSKTSSITFKNSSNVLGFVSTTETTDVMDGILGYKNSNGMLVFSTVIDGGTY